MTTSSFWSGSVRGGAPSAAQAASMAAMAAASNLFHKVVAALERDQAERAERLATQAAQRPFDDHEEVWPGPEAAHYALFELVTDTIEEWPEGDHTWVEAFADLTSRASGRQRDELRHLAAVLHQDASVLAVDDDEARRLHGVADGADPRARLSENLPEEERPGYVLELARLVIEARTALDRAIAEVSF